MSAGSSRVVRQGSAYGMAWREEVADRDPDTIKRDIDVARDQLAATVDTLAERANPQRIANDIKAAVVRVREEACGGRLAGRRRRPGCGGHLPPHSATLTKFASAAKSGGTKPANQKLGGLATRPRRLQV